MKPVKTGAWITFVLAGPDGVYYVGMRQDKTLTWKNEP